MKVAFVLFGLAVLSTMAVSAQTRCTQTCNTYGNQRVCTTQCF